MGRLQKTGRHPHEGPQLSYHRALRLQVSPEWTVASCPLDEFIALIEQATSTAKDPQSCARALTHHDFSEPSARWHALLLLHQHQATLPVLDLRI
jgi:hypothetical protein